MTEPLRWDRMTVNEIRDAMTKTSTVLIPMGCVEQHGYHLTTRTDSLSAETIADGASGRTGAIVAPTYPYTYSGGELPGTINISPSVVGLFVSEILRELSRQGWRNLVIVLGHGGTENDAAVQGAADIFLRTHPERGHVNVAVYRFWQVSESARRAYEDHDYHAGYFETSMMLYMAPDQVRDELVLDQPALVDRMREDPDSYQTRVKNVDHEAVLPHIHQDPQTKVGVIGDPSRASRELGKQLIEEAVEGLVELVGAMQQAG